MGYIEGASREQVTMFPPTLDDYVGPAHLVRVIDLYVERQDLATLGFERSAPAPSGRPGYDPRLMLKLYLYGYLNRVRSSRRLEQEARRNVELLWLLGRLAPDFKTIADFRGDNGAAIRALCRAFSVFCVQQGLMAGELIAIDGAKFAGVNHKGRNFDAKKLAARRAALEKRIAAYLAQLDAADATEAAGPAAPDRAAIEAALEALTARRDELKVRARALRASGERQVSLTDPDARAMKSGGGGAVVGYNVQISVDAAHRLIVGFEVTNDGNDRNQLARQAKAAKDLLKVERLEVVADAGYAHAAQYAECETAGITPYVPDCAGHSAAQHRRFGREHFVYDARHDQYRCPAGQTLTHASTPRRAGHRVRVYRTAACAGCRLRAQCTSDARNGREITRVPNAEATEAMRERIKAYPDKLKQRKALVEHPFGTLKRTWGHGYFLLKRLPKVTTEMSLSVLCYNLRRVMNILGTEVLMQKLATA